MSKRKQLQEKMEDNTAKTNILFNLLSKFSSVTNITKERVIVETSVVHDKRQANDVFGAGSYLNISFYDISSLTDQLGKF